MVVALTRLLSASTSIFRCDGGGGCSGVGGQVGDGGSDRSRSGRCCREGCGSGRAGSRGGGHRSGCAPALVGGRTPGGAAWRIAAAIAVTAAVGIAAAAADAAVGGSGGCESSGGGGDGASITPPSNRQATVSMAAEPTKEPYPLADAATTYWAATADFPNACQAVSLTLRGTLEAAGRPGVSFIPSHALSTDGGACGVAPPATSATGGSLTAGTGVGVLVTTRAAMLSEAAAAAAGVSDLYTIVMGVSGANQVLRSITFLDIHVAVARDGSVWCPPTATDPTLPRGAVALLMRLGNDTVDAPGLGFTLTSGDSAVWVVHPSGLTCVYVRQAGSDGKPPPEAVAAAADRPPIETIPSEPIAGPTPTPRWGFQCFPADAVVAVRGRRTTVRMDALVPGDELPCASCTDGWSPVYAFGHATPGGLYPFVTITAVLAGGNESAAGVLTEEMRLTGGHYLAVGGSWRRADEVVVGDTLTGLVPSLPFPDARSLPAAAAAATTVMTSTSPPEFMSAWKWAQSSVGVTGKARPPSPPTTTWVVTATRLVHRRGLYAPLTMAGELGVGHARLRVSAYAMPPAVGAAVTAPLRAAWAAGIPPLPVHMVLERVRRVVGVVWWAVSGGETEA